MEIETAHALLADALLDQVQAAGRAVDGARELSEFRHRVADGERAGADLHGSKSGQLAKGRGVAVQVENGAGAADADGGRCLRRELAGC